MNLEKLIESHYAPKKGNDLLVKLIESKMNEAYSIQNIQQIQKPVNPKDQLFYGDERILKLPIIRFTKEIGKKNNYERDFLDLVFSNIPKIAGRASERIEQRIQSIQDFLTPENINPNIQISEIMSYCIISETFYHLVNDYDATVSGDLFEPLFAAMFDGSIVEMEGGEQGKTKRNIKAEDVIIPTDDGVSEYNQAVSLKLLAERGSVSQNFKNVLNTIKERKSLIYIVGYKSSAGSIKFYGINLTEKNILEAVSNLNEMFEPFQVNIFKKEFKNPPNKNYSIVGHMLSKLEISSQEANKIENDIKEIEELINQKEELITKEFNKGKDQMNNNFIKAMKLEIAKHREQVAELAGQLKLKKHKTSMKITADYFIKNGVSFGEIIYTKENLKNVLQNYTNIVNKKVTDIYDNLSLLTNSINDFFLMGQGQDLNLARTSIDKARQVEQSIITHTPGAAE